MGARATLTSKGQITIPKEVRERLSLGPGDTIEFVEEAGRTWLKPRNIAVSDMFGMLGEPRAGKGSSQQEMDEAVREAVAAHVTGSGKR